MSDGSYIYDFDGSCTFDEKCIPVTGPGFYGPYVTPGSTRTEENE